MISSSEDETARLGRLLGSALREGDVLFVEGPLGAGKTCLIRGICEGLGFVGKVRSPSFAVVNEYKGRSRICHVDLYRIPEGSPELDDLSRQEYFADDAITLVEWGGKLEPWGVRPTLTVTMRIAGDERRGIDLRVKDPGLANRLKHLKSRW